MAIVADRSDSAIIYVDGAHDGGGDISAESGDLAGSFPFLIGINYNKGGTPDRDFEGTVDEVRIWNTLRTLEDIRTSMCRKMAGNEAGLVSYWRLDEGSGSTTYDLVDYPTGNNGTREGFIDGWVTSTAPVGDESHFGIGSDGLTEGSGVPVDIVWDGNDPGADAVFDAIEVNDHPDVTTGLPANHPATYWELWITGDDGSFLADVRFHYDEIGGIGDEANLALYTRSSPGYGWNEVASHTVDDEGDNTDGIGSITANDLTSFSQFIVASDDPDNPLPVELSLFTATASDGKVVLCWRTQSEVENMGFNIYRGNASSGPFTRINDSLIPGAGSSPHPHDYTFIDMDVKVGLRYYYFLEDVDTADRRNRSETIEVFVETAVPEEPPDNCALFQNYPNPSNPGTWIPYRLDSASPVILRIYDIRGRLVRVLAAGRRKAGSHTTYWDGRDNSGRRVASGVYHYSLRTGEFTSTRKMVVMK